MTDLVTFSFGCIFSISSIENDFRFLVLIWEFDIFDESFYLMLLDWMRVWFILDLFWFWFYSPVPYGDLFLNLFCKWVSNFVYKFCPLFLLFSLLLRCLTVAGFFNKFLVADRSSKSISPSDIIRSDIIWSLLLTLILIFKFWPGEWLALLLMLMLILLFVCLALYTSFGLFEILKLLTKSVLLIVSRSLGLVIHWLFYVFSDLSDIMSILRFLLFECPKWFEFESIALLLNLSSNLGSCIKLYCFSFFFTSGDWLLFKYFLICCKSLSLAGFLFLS